MWASEHVLTYSSAHASTVRGSASSCPRTGGAPGGLGSLLGSATNPQKMTRVVQPNSSDSCPVDELTRSHVSPHSSTCD